MQLPQNWIYKCVFSSRNLPWPSPPHQLCHPCCPSPPPPYLPCTPHRHRWRHLSLLLLFLSIHNAPTSSLESLHHHQKPEATVQIFWTFFLLVKDDLIAVATRKERSTKWFRISTASREFPGNPDRRWWEFGSTVCEGKTVCWDCGGAPASCQLTAEKGEEESPPVGGCWRSEWVCAEERQEMFWLKPWGNRSFRDAKPWHYQKRKG